MLTATKEVAMKRSLGPTQNLYPMPCPIVVGGTMECANALAVAWINVVSSTPPTVAMGLRRTRRTLELIRENGSFTVNVPDTALAAETDYLGITSGGDNASIEASGLVLAPGSVVSTPVIEQCPYNLECKVTGEVEVGEYVVVLGEVVESHAEERVLDETGKKCDVGKLDPLVYIAGSREYRGLGEKIADAFSVGKTIAPKA